MVQAGGNLEDTDWMLEVAHETNWIKGVVGWLPLKDTVAAEKTFEEKYVSEKYFKGVRRQIHDEQDPEWLLQPALLESLQFLAEKNMVYDVVAVLPQHIETVLKVAHKIPGLKMVFDHLSQPPVKDTKKFERWRDLMKEASQYKNFYAKISGLGTACGVANWNDDDLKPSIEFALASFGTDRCFCGGDWPVSLLAGSYTKTWTSYKNIISDLLDVNDSNKVFYSNAIQFYNL